MLDPPEGSRFKGLQGSGPSVKFLWSEAPSSGEVTTAGARMDNVRPQQRPLSPAVGREGAPSNQLFGNLGPENEVRAGPGRCACTILSAVLREPCKCER